MLFLVGSGRQGTRAQLGDHDRGRVGIDTRTWTGSEMEVSEASAPGLATPAHVAAFPRVASIWAQRMPSTPANIDILPPPRGLDPRVVSWRGGTVMTRLEIMQDMWIKRSEWSDIGMRAYKNRVY
jgi:hypothetical protein